MHEEKQYGFTLKSAESRFAPKMLAYMEAMEEKTGTTFSCISCNDML